MSLITLLEVAAESSTMFDVMRSVIFFTGPNQMSSIFSFLSLLDRRMVARISILFGLEGTFAAATTGESIS